MAYEYEKQGLNQYRKNSTSKTNTKIYDTVLDYYPKNLDSPEQAAGSHEISDQLDDVYVYKNSEEPQKFGAGGITKKNHIFLARGEESLLRHEAGHVLQQKKRRSIWGDELVSGQAVSRNREVERDADALGSRIPQSTLSWLMSRSTEETVTSQEMDGVVLCGKKKGKVTSGKAGKTEETEKTENVELAKLLKDIEDKKAELQASRELTGSRQAREAKMEVAKAEWEQSIEKLRTHLLRNPGLSTDLASGTITAPKYGYDESAMAGTDNANTQAVVEQIITVLSREGEISALDSSLQGHIFLGLSVGAGEREGTGLHAYSDYQIPQGKRHILQFGGLPNGITPKGYIGDRNQVHILYWEDESNKGKFSTMLPMNLPEGVANLMYSMAKSGTTSFGGEEYQLQTCGETIYPVASGVTHVTLGELTRLPGVERSSKDDSIQSEGPMTLDELFRFLDNHREPGESEAILEALEEIGDYTVLY